MADALTSFIRSEMDQKQIPAVSIALIDDQRIVWSAGFGQARTNVPATADTIYRVGSVSKLFTDVALMQLVDRGEVELDAPVTKYLPSFRPTNRFEKPITVRQLMTHRAGLCRETPIGNYFDPSEPSLADTIASLNQTEIVYEPGMRTKYSNAAIALVGYLLELQQKKPFTGCIQDLLQPLGLRESSFIRNPAISSNLADGQMWTLHGRTFKAPEFELGIAPAACMYSSVNDLAHFMFVLLDREGETGRKILKPESWNEMLRIQFATPTRKYGFGLGFYMSEMFGGRAASHNGAMYGFATQFTALIDAKIGVVVIASKDFANTITERIATKALQAMFVVKQPPADAPESDRQVRIASSIAARFEPPTQPLPPQTRIGGHFSSGDRSVHIRHSGTNTFLTWNDPGYQHTIRRRGDQLVTDSPLGYGIVLEPEGDGVRIGEVSYKRTDPPLTECPREWRGLIGEYGWDHDVLYILEREGKLWCLIEWFEFNPLQQLSENIFAFPNRGLYDGEKLVFKRDASGRATEVIAANVTFKRRNIEPETGKQARIKPLRPVTDLRAESIRATPPAETNQFRQPDLIKVANPGILYDVRYATDDNFLGTRIYSNVLVLLQRPAAEALLRAKRRLEAEKSNLGFSVFDAYRPWSVTKLFWEATPPEYRWLVADPAKGSRHNRGAAVDLTLCNIVTGVQLEMPGTYDEPTDRSYPDYPGGTTIQRHSRDLLRGVMESEGFTVYPEEWWHFDYKDWREYPIMNVPFEKLAGREPPPL